MRKNRTSTVHSPFFSAERPDIPLREPLDEESKNKRKAARDIFEREKWEKVMQNKYEKDQLENEKKLEGKITKITNKLAEAEKRVKANLNKEMKKMQNWEMKRKEARRREEMKRKEDEKEIYSKYVHWLQIWILSD